MQSKILVVAAHPDDEVLGCGAFINKKINQKSSAKLITMTSGCAGRQPSLASTKSENKNLELEIKTLKEEQLKATKVIGFSEVIQLEFPDNRMDTISRMDVSLALKPIINDYKPDLILTHHPGDYNWDHSLTFEAVMMAARANFGDFFPSEIWTFEVLSSTERAWQNPLSSFHPNVYVDVEKTIDQKKLALTYYSSEYRNYPHPRSIEAVEYLARKRGNEVGLKYAEAFHMIRKIESK